MGGAARAGRWLNRVNRATRESHRGGIHFRFDQEAGADLGRAVGTYVYKHNLRRAKSSEHDEEDDKDDEHGRRN